MHLAVTTSPRRTVGTHHTTSILIVKLRWEKTVRMQQSAVDDAAQARDLKVGAVYACRKPAHQEFPTFISFGFSSAPSLDLQQFVPVLYFLRGPLVSANSPTISSVSGFRVLLNSSRMEPLNCTPSIVVSTQAATPNFRFIPSFPQPGGPWFIFSIRPGKSINFGFTPSRRIHRAHLFSSFCLISTVSASFLPFSWQHTARRP
ncbi:hypothetical protein QBC35DRAFT_31578 [Podospora australis]|uniref:Uncharacterized protein n=1 Tax=Podospora australis TaxID=1536484 RepID=A0AAN7AGK9_9PEZI|nr:hypothetical protein QBC35DRAFT_31578 [Podospora australis]